MNSRNNPKILDKQSHCWPCTGRTAPVRVQVLFGLKQVFFVRMGSWTGPRRPKLRGNLLAPTKSAVVRANLAIGRVRQRGVVDVDVSLRHGPHHMATCTTLADRGCTRAIRTADRPTEHVNCPPVLEYEGQAAVGRQQMEGSRRTGWALCTARGGNKVWHCDPPRAQQRT